MLNEIYLPENFKDQYHFLSDIKETISGLNRINIFIGPNNSGKSRLLREVFQKDFKYHLSGLDFRTNGSLVDELQTKIDDALNQFNLREASSLNIPNIKKKIGDIKEKLSSGLPGEFVAHKELNELLDNAINFTLSQGTVLQTGENSDHNGFSNKVREIATLYLTRLAKVDVDFELPKFQKVYIPMLRGLRPVQLKGNIEYVFSENENNYRKRTIYDYFPQQGEKNRRSDVDSSDLNITTGLNLYEEVRRMLLGTIDQREQIKAFEIFLSQTFFDSQPVSLIPHIEKDCLYITIGKTDRPIYELGDGVQNIIILLYPIFFHSDEDLLCFIEEPEISLHPGMQRLFIDTIMHEKFKKVQFFFTTHSNHFLDMTLDHEQISIYNFQRREIEGKPQYFIENTQNEDIRLLESIGVRNSSVFISNCTIWVEGITDRLYLNKYMEVLQKHELAESYESKRLKEDLHFSYIEYGGANIVHYSFDDDDNWEKIKASKISSKIMIIVDEDGISQKPASAKYLRLEELKKHLGDNLVTLPCREIENMLSVKILKETIQEWEGQQTLNFGSFKEEDYKDKYLGQFIEKELSGIKKKYTEKGGSGTLSKKVLFCKSAISHIKAIEDLSDSAKEVAKKVLQFIKTNNNTRL